MNTTSEIEPGDIAHVGSGYYPNGDSRPEREVTVTSVAGRFARFVYNDTGESGLCPTYCLRFDDVGYRLDLIH